MKRELNRILKTSASKDEFFEMQRRIRKEMDDNFKAWPEDRSPYCHEFDEWLDNCNQDGEPFKMWLEEQRIRNSEAYMVWVALVELDFNYYSLRFDNINDVDDEDQCCDNLDDNDDNFDNKNFVIVSDKGLLTGPVKGKDLDEVTHELCNAYPDLSWEIEEFETSEIAKTELKALVG